MLLRHWGVGIQCSAGRWADITAALLPRHGVGTCKKTNKKIRRQPGIATLYPVYRTLLCLRHSPWAGRMGRSPWQPWWKQQNLRRQRLVYDLIRHPVLETENDQNAGGTHPSTEIHLKSIDNCRTVLPAALVRCGKGERGVRVGEAGG